MLQPYDDTLPATFVSLMTGEVSLQRVLHGGVWKQKRKSVVIIPIIVYFRATLELNNETVANGTGIDMVATYTCIPGFAFTGKFLYNHEHLF